jgi:anti-sigma B factor antagonist
MPAEKVTITVRKARKVGILDIRGEINAFAENALMDAYTEASTGDAKAILLNFNGLQYMNSSGIGLLVTLLIRVKRQNQRLMAYGLNEHYKQIFELTRLNEAITIFEDEDDALAAAGV